MFKYVLYSKENNVKAFNLTFVVKNNFLYLNNDSVVLMTEHC